MSAMQAACNATAFQLRECPARCLLHYVREACASHAASTRSTYHYSARTRRKTVTLAWCLTPLNSPSKHLHGPFATRERAQREAMRLLSHEAKVIASEALRMPPMLVPTPCRTTCVQHQRTAYVPLPATSSQGARRVSHTHVTTSTAANNASASSAQQASPTPQAMAIYRLTEGKLRYMAAQLGIPLGNTVTRAGIIDILTKELDLL